MGIIGHVIALRWEEVLAALLAYHCYLRPFEVEGLHSKQVVFALDPIRGDVRRVGLVLARLEVGRPSKTGQWDEAVVIDQLPAIIAGLLALKRRGDAGDGRLWSFPPGTLSALMRDSAAQLGLQNFVSRGTASGMVARATTY